MFLYIKETNSNYSAETNSRQHPKILIDTTSQFLQLGNPFPKVESIYSSDLKIKTSRKPGSKLHPVLYAHFTLATLLSSYVKDWVTAPDEGSPFHMQIPLEPLELRQDNRFDVKIIE